MTFCDTPSGIEVSFWADGTGRTDGTTDGWTDRRGSRNSYLDATQTFKPRKKVHLDNITKGIINVVVCLTDNYLSLTSIQ